MALRHPIASCVYLLLVAAIAVSHLCPVRAAPAAADVAESQEKRSAGDHDCLVNGYRFSHGEVFSIPGHSHCLRYLCQYQGYHVHQEACEHDGQCHSVGSTYQKDCRTYRCENNNNWYQSRVISSLCKDAYGNCRHEGESFPYVIGGHHFNRCQCIISSDHSVRYSCGGK